MFDLTARHIMNLQEKSANYITHRTSLNKSTKIVIIISSKSFIF